MRSELAGAHSQQGVVPGATFGDRYVLCELIGEGGMGRVFRAVQTALARSVAVKFLRPSLASDPRLRRRFHDEVRAASLVSHPHAVAVIDFGVSGSGEPFLVMEYVPGPSLNGILRSQGPLSLRRAVRLVDQILSALEDAHTAGVVHADIKSDNVLVQSEAGGTERVKIIDFGLARLRSSPDAKQVDDGMLSGTPDYLAPEVIRGQIPTAAADLYAVGIVLFELLTGTTPFGGGSAVEILERHLRDEVVPPSLRRPDRLIPPALERVVVRSLAKEPAARFADARSFRTALAEVTEEMNLDAIEVCFCPECGAATSGPTDATSRSDATTHNWGPSDEEPVSRRRWPRGSRSRAVPPR